MDVKASKTIFVGDTPGIDIKGAKNVGMKGVLIKRRRDKSCDSISLVYKPSEEDADVEPDRIIYRLRVA